MPFLGFPFLRIFRNPQGYGPFSRSCRFVSVVSPNRTICKIQPGLSKHEGSRLSTHSLPIFPKRRFFAIPRLYWSFCCLNPPRRVFSHPQISGSALKFPWGGFSPHPWGGYPLVHWGRAASPLMLVGPPLQNLPPFGSRPGVSGGSAT